MAKIWATLFASAGDKIVIPVPVDPSGSVSITQGWTPDYELSNTDPNYKPVGREEMNGAFNEVTGSIQQLQLQGAAEWSALLLPYPKGADVIYSGERYRSIIAGNNDTPGATANWVLAGPVTVGVYSGNSVVTTGQTFTVADVGKAIEINSASATAHNLPAAIAYASGKAISFANIGAGISTFNRVGSDTITGGNLAAATDIPLNNGETVTLVSDGASKWYVAASNVTFFQGKNLLRNTSSGTSFDFPIAPNATEFSVVLVGVSLSGTDDILIQFGVAGSPVTSGYSAASGNIIAGSTAVSNSTSGFPVRGAAPLNQISSTVTFKNIGGNIWQSSHSGRNSTGSVICGGGDIALAGPLNLVRITRTTTDTFDGGALNIIGVK